MKLSEAIRTGRPLRPETHREAFCRIANLDTLASDVWGAACEAVHSLVAKRNWNDSDEKSFQSDLDYLDAIKMKYFGDYFKMPACCPGASPRKIVKDRTKGAINRFGDYIIDASRDEYVGAITSECAKVTNMGQLVDHLFRIHNWSSEEVAAAVEFYENAQGSAIVLPEFTHYQDETLRQRLSERLNLAARQRERQYHRQIARNRQIFVN